MTSTRTSHLPLSLAGAAAIAVLLTACGREDNRTAGQKLDDGVATVEQAAKNVGAKTEAATEKAVATAGDAAITVAINAALAKDSELSATKIDVDTTAGHVRLSGEAPNTAARDRATTLARGIDGVVGVDNQLRVRS